MNPTAKRKQRQRATGWVSQKEGDGWEAALEQTHAEYARVGLALIEKKPTPTNPVKKSWLHPRLPEEVGRRVRMFAARSSYDYHGVIGCEPEPGQAIAMEAKHSGKPKPSMRVSLLTKQEAEARGVKGTGEGLQWHQLCALHDALAFNGLAVVVWANGISHAGGSRLVLLPDRVCALYQEASELRGKQNSMSIKRSAFTEFRTGRVGDGRTGVVVEHWLEPVIDWMKAKKGGGNG